MFVECVSTTVVCSLKGNRYSLPGKPWLISFRLKSHAFSYRDLPKTARFLNAFQAPSRDPDIHSPRSVGLTQQKQINRSFGMPKTAPSWSTAFTFNGTQPYRLRITSHHLQSVTTLLWLIQTLNWSLPNLFYSICFVWLSLL